MGRLHQVFAEAAQHGRKGLLPYLTAGYPDLATTLALLRRISPGEAHCVELGIPFSDPIADGPVIQASFSYALDRAFHLDDLLERVAGARAEIAVPLVLMVSYSIVYRRNPATFVERLRSAGIDGMIVPDLALEEAEELSGICGRHDCPLVLMVAPTTSPARRARIARLAQPFIYYQSVAGVTGERDRLPDDLTGQVRDLRQAAGKPVCVGFGISRPEQVSAVCEVADGAIVGSAIVRRITSAMEAGQSGAALADDVLAFIRELAAPLDLSAGGQP